MIQRFFISAIALFALIFTSCDTEHTTYSGPSYVMFADSMTVLPVQNNDEVFDIAVVATQTSDKDRRFGIEVIESKSNAIEHRHYVLEDYNVVIPAGERVGYLKVRGIKDNISVGDSLGITIQIICDEQQAWDIYGVESHIILQKACPMDMNIFTGYAVLTSSYLKTYAYNMQRLVKSYIDPNDPNSIIISDCFYDDFDVKVRLSNDDILSPIVKFEDQVAASTVEAFGTLYGDGNIHIRETSTASYYSTCEGFLVMYFNMYVSGMPESSNQVGTFVNIFEWISDAEAEEILRNGL
ncbi:MAG: DUF4984 domain-containing protein [Bacteroidia bacterium]|nr:DUF4984 domain-containing protein [Bacteroidia bacterium]